MTDRTRATPILAVPAILLVAACATRPDDAAPETAERVEVASAHRTEPDAPRPERQLVAFEAVVVVSGTGETQTVLLRAVSPVMEFAPTDRFWMERDGAGSVKVALHDMEDDLFTFEATDVSTRRLRFEDGERVILSLIGHIPWLDDDREREQRASDVAPWPTPRTR